MQLNVTALDDGRAGRDGGRGLRSGGPGHVVSVFAGRIADTGRDPIPLMTEALAALAARPEARADLGEPARAAQHRPGRARSACHIITVTHDLLAKLPSFGKDLDQFSLETVQMFHGDAAAPGTRCDWPPTLRP